MPWGKNYEKELKELDQLNKAVRKGMQDGVNHAAKILEAAVKRAAPVDTGELKSAITTGEYQSKDINKKGARVYVGTWYRHLVEYGHEKGKGKGAAQPYPYIRPTFVQNKLLAERAIGKAVANAVKKELGE